MGVFVMINTTKTIRTAKKLFVRMGVYREARTLYRHLNKSEMETYIVDKRFYSQLLPHKGVLCFDVGANIGRIANVLLELGHRVIAFEPQPECVKEITARCRPYNHNLRVEETALGDSPGKATLYVRESGRQSTLRQTWEGRIARTIQVPVSTLDRAIERFGLPQYCKIDVEGWELEVLRGLSHPISLISFEYHQGEGRMQDAYACLDRLRSSANIRINITPKERSEFAVDEWMDADEFRTMFQTQCEGREEFVYGDLYVRML
jgi:FkbM family methyltransferase